MKEVYRSADVVKLTWLQSVLQEEEIEAVMMDEHVNAIYAGNVVEQRLMVVDEDAERAAELIKQAEKDL